MKQIILQIKFGHQVFAIYFLQKGRCILFKITELYTYEQLMPKEGNLITSLD